MEYFLEFCRNFVRLKKALRVEYYLQIYPVANSILDVEVLFVLAVCAQCLTGYYAHVKILKWRRKKSQHERKKKKR